MELKAYIKHELDIMAAQDSNFRARYEDKANSLDRCVLYIMQQARKQAVNNCAAISNTDIIQMAVHYYQEMSVEPTADTSQATVKASAKPAKPQPVLIPKQPAKPQPVQTAAKPKAKKGKKKQTEDPLQLNLFD